MTGERRFVLVIPRPPGPVALDAGVDPEDSLPPRLEIENIRRIMESATPSLRAVQRRYKAYFDKRVRLLRRADACETVYVRREAEREEDQAGVKRRHKLKSKSIGPYKVIEASSNTVVIVRDGLYEPVSRDRIALAPSPRGADEPLRPESELAESANDAYTLETVEERVPPTVGEEGEANSAGVAVERLSSAPQDMENSVEGDIST